MRNSMAVPCDDWEEKLAAIHPNDLLPAEREALSRHILSCSACASVLAEYREMNTLIRRSLTSERPLELPKDFAVRRRQKERTGQYGWRWIKSTLATHSSLHRSSPALAGNTAVQYSSPYYSVCILAQCLSQYTEVLFDTNEQLRAEVLIEVCVDQVLRSLFEAVTMVQAHLHFFPASLKKQQRYSIQVNAQCRSSSLPPHPHTLERMELTVEEAISGILPEFFGALIIDEVSISCSTNNGTKRDDADSKTA
jgi:hypothetical protein